MIKTYRAYFIFFAALLVFVFLVGFNGLYGQDSYEYLRFTNCLSAFYRTGTPPGDFFWPLLYPVIGSLVSFAVKPVMALQLISIVAFIGSAVYLEKIIEYTYAPSAKTKNVFVFLFFLLSPYMLRASLVVMSDMLAIFFLTGSYYYMVKYRIFLQGKYFFLFIAFAMAAITTRYAAFMLLIVPGLFIKTEFLKHFRWKAFVASGLIAIVIALPHFLLRSKAPLAFLQHDWVTQWAFANYGKDSFTTANGNAEYAFMNIIYVFFNFFHPAFCFPGALFVVMMLFRIKRKPGKTLQAASLSVLLYALFLAGIPLQNMRFLLLSFPMVAIMFFPHFEGLMDYLTVRGNFNAIKKTIVYILVVAIQLALFIRVFMPFYHDNRTERMVAEEVLKYPGIPVYTFAIDGALKAYGVNNKIVSLYHPKLDSVKGQKLVLFNENRFADVWKDKPPMLNWQYLQHTYPLTKLKDLPDGWTLYTSP